MIRFTSDSTGFYDASRTIVVELFQKKTNNESDARSFVLKEIAELQTLFSKEETQVSFLSALKEKEKYWQNKSKTAEKEKDIDGALYANEILGAINLLRQATQEE